MFTQKNQYLHARACLFFPIISKSHFIYLAMAANEEITERIYFLYLDDYDIHEAVEFMRHRNISAEVVKSVYKQLSADDDKMADRFHCYTIKIGNNGYSGKINYWTSRYLIGRESESLNPGFHEITIFDSFNNKSM
jgi:hypothetical protein